MTRKKMSQKKILFTKGRIIAPFFWATLPTWPRVGFVILFGSWCSIRWYQKESVEKVASFKF